MTETAPVITTVPQFVLDTEVDAVLDQQLRDLLSSCFTKPADGMFRERRYWQEAPTAHWIVRDESGALIAHAALHEKTVGTKLGDLKIGGIGDVCVHPSQRGRGLVKVLLNAIHQHMFDKRIPFGMLFGDAGVYASSGYISVINPLKYRDLYSGSTLIKSNPTLMIHPLGITMWPPGTIDLRGPLF